MSNLGEGHAEPKSSAQSSADLAVSDYLKTLNPEVLRALDAGLEAERRGESAETVARFAMYIELVSSGRADRNTARLACDAVHALDSHVMPSMRLTRTIRRRSRALAKDLRHADPSSVHNRAVEAIKDYREAAVRYGDGYYTAKFSIMLLKDEARTRDLRSEG